MTVGGRAALAGLLFASQSVADPPPIYTPRPVGVEGHSLQLVCWRISDVKEGRWVSICVPGQFLVPCTENSTQISCDPKRPVPTDNGLKTGEIPV
jgi:hypothetical protein